MSDEKKNGFGNAFRITKDQLPFALKLLTVAFAGVLILNFANLFYNADSDQPTAQIGDEKTGSPIAGYISSTDALETKLEEVLGEITGAGNVSVSIIMAEGTSREYAVNVTTSEKQVEEKDQAGGVRTTTEKQESGEVVMLEGNQEPVLVKESMPKIQGILVVAEGAGDPLVKERLFFAVQGVLQIPAHKITICFGNER